MRGPPLTAPRLLLSGRDSGSGSGKGTSSLGPPTQVFRGPADSQESSASRAKGGGLTGCQ